MSPKQNKSRLTNSYRKSCLQWNSDIRKSYPTQTTTKNTFLTSTSIFVQRALLSSLSGSLNDIDLQPLSSLPVYLIESIRDDIYRSAGFEKIRKELRNSVKVSSVRLLHQIPLDLQLDRPLTVQNHHQHKLIVLSLFSPVDVIQSICEWTVRQSNHHHTDEGITILKSLRSALVYKEESQNETTLEAWLQKTTHLLQSPYETTNLFAIISAFLRIDPDADAQRKLSFLFVLKHILYPMLQKKQYDDLNRLSSFLINKPHDIQTPWLCERNIALEEQLRHIASHTLDIERNRGNFKLVNAALTLISNLISLCSPSFCRAMEEIFGFSRYWYLCHGLTKSPERDKVRIAAFVSFLEQAVATLTDESRIEQFIEVCETVLIAVACGGLTSDVSWFQKIAVLLSKREGYVSEGEESIVVSVWVIAMTRQIPLLADQEMSRFCDTELHSEAYLRTNSGIEAGEINDNVVNLGTPFVHVAIRAIVLSGSKQADNLLTGSIHLGSSDRFARALSSSILGNTKKHRYLESLTEVLRSFSRFRCEQVQKSTIDIFKLLAAQLVTDLVRQSAELSGSDTVTCIRQMASQYSVDGSVSESISKTISSVLESKMECKTEDGDLS